MNVALGFLPNESNSSGLRPGS
eukprot:SAG22_NODE_21586_length_256_cov_0.515924_1_plen_21_part_10